MLLSISACKAAFQILSVQRLLWANPTTHISVWVNNFFKDINQASLVMRIRSQPQHQYTCLFFQARVSLAWATPPSPNTDSDDSDASASPPTTAPWTRRWRRCRSKTSGASSSSSSWCPNWKKLFSFRWKLSTAFVSVKSFCPGQCFFLLPYLALTLVRR